MSFSATKVNDKYVSFLFSSTAPLHFWAWRQEVTDPQPSLTSTLTGWLVSGLPTCYNMLTIQWTGEWSNTDSSCMVAKCPANPHNFACRYPWGQEAFDKAKSEDKPIFLSGWMPHTHSRTWLPFVAHLYWHHCISNCYICHYCVIISLLIEFKFIQLEITVFFFYLTIHLTQNICMKCLSDLQWATQHATGVTLWNGSLSRMRILAGF